MQTFYADLLILREIDLYMCIYAKGVGEGGSHKPPHFQKWGALVGLCPPPHFWTDQVF